jgi:UDP-N-acetylmuramate-alanine ligase
MRVMQKVHLVSGSGPLIFDIALAIRERSHEVSVSGDNFNPNELATLIEAGCICHGNGWFPEKLTKDINFVVLGSTVGEDNPELKRARELGLLVQSIPEFIYQRTREKTRVVVAGTHGKKTILSMISYVLQCQKMDFSYAFTSKVSFLPNHVSMNYESRIALIEGDERVASLLENRVRMEFYRPHIAILTSIEWTPSDKYDSLESYIGAYKSFVSSIGREGKLIYFAGDTAVAELASDVREDITAISYDSHAVEEKDGKNMLVTRYGNFPVHISDDYFLANLNAARIACRQLGVKDADFYQAISDYSLS